MLAVTLAACTDRLDRPTAPVPRQIARTSLMDPICRFDGDRDNWRLTTDGCDGVDSSFANRTVSWVGPVDPLGVGLRAEYQKQIFAVLEYRWPKDGSGYGITVARLQPVNQDSDRYVLPPLQGGGYAHPFFVDTRLSDDLAGIAIIGFAVQCVNASDSPSDCFEQLAQTNAFHPEPRYCIDNGLDSLFANNFDGTLCPAMSGSTTPFGNRNPIGRITIGSDVAGVLPSTRRVVLSASGTTDREGASTLSYNWNLTSTALTAPKVDSTLEPDFGDLPYGRYTAQLKVRDVNGGFDYSEADITVASGGTTMRKKIQLDGPTTGAASDRVSYHARILPMESSEGQFSGFWTVNGAKYDACMNLASCTFRLTSGTTEVAAYHRYRAGAGFTFQTASGTITTSVP